MTYQAFLQGRIDLVKKLRESSSVMVTYHDLVLILTAVISACAACRWPGEGFDQKRFVESLIQFGSPELNLDHVSTGSLLQLGVISLSESPWGIFGQELNVFPGDQIDGPIQSMAERYQRVTLKQFKQASYANRIYECLRCSYAHNYWPDDYTTEDQTYDFPAQISYSRCRDRDGKEIIEAHIHLDYLIDVAQQQVSKLIEGSLERPTKWWLKQT